MLLRKVSLLNFRNYKKKEFFLGENGCFLVGKNTSGKTNFLEAVYLLATGKSFRAGREREMIFWGEEVGRVEAEVEIGGEKERLEVVIAGKKGRRGGKRFKINGVGKRQVDFVGKMAAVLFWPEDLEMITGRPSLRRKYINRVLVQADREYRVSLSAYEKGLRQRNKLLDKIKEGRGKREQLYFWDRLLIKNGGIVTSKREEFVDFLNKRIDVFYDLEIFYDKSAVSEKRLKKYEREELLAGATLVGPHRDDIKVNLRSRKKKELIDLQRFGSRGEQRLAVLALKLAEVEFLAERFKERPVLLLDDIFSELDKEHRKLVLEKVFNQQTVITATERLIFKREYLEEMRVIEI